MLKTLYCTTLPKPSSDQPSTRKSSAAEIKLEKGEQFSLIRLKCCMHFCVSDQVMNWSPHHEKACFAICKQQKNADLFVVPLDACTASVFGLLAHLS